MYFSASYGLSDDVGLDITEFKAPHVDQPCEATSPDLINDFIEKCEALFKTVHGDEVYSTGDDTLYITIGGTRITVMGADNIDPPDRLGAPYITAKTENVMKRFFDGLQKVDPTKLEYVDRSNMHAAN